MAFGLALLGGTASGQELGPASCQFGREVSAWQGQVDCFRLSVQENRARSDSDHIDLAVYLLNQRVGEGGTPVFYLSGGPGVAGSYYVNLLLRHPLRDDRPIIILEQRGVGQSGELCPSVRRNYYRRVAARQDNDLRRRQFIGLMLNCFDDVRDDGRDLDAYTTIENAADLADLRRAVGLEQIDIWAVSYGTVLAQVYLRLEPEHAGAIVFDAAVPIDYALETNLAQNFRNILAERWEDCVVEGGCEVGAPDFEARLETVIDDYNRRPLRLLGFSPEPSIVVNYVYVTGVDAAGIVFSLLYEQPNTDAINRVLSLLERGSGSFLRAHYQRLANPGFSFGMHYAVNCRGVTASEDQLAELQLADPILFDAMQTGLQSELCINSDLTMPPEGANDPVQFERNVLIMAGEHDPITPLSVGESLRAGFPRAAFLEIRSGGHGPSRSLPCAQQIIRGYFADPAEPIYDFCSLLNVDGTISGLD